MIDVTIESVSEESVKMFDNLAINPLRILLGVTDDQRGVPQSSIFCIYYNYRVDNRLSHLEASRLTPCVKRQLGLDTLLQQVALLVLN